MSSFGINSFDVPTNKLPDLESILRLCIQSSRPCFLMFMFNELFGTPDQVLMVFQTRISFLKPFLN